MSKKYYLKYIHVGYFCFRHGLWSSFLHCVSADWLQECRDALPVFISALRLCRKCHTPEDNTDIVSDNILENFSAPEMFMWSTSKKSSWLKRLSPI